MANQTRVKLTDVAVCLIQLSVTSPCLPAYYLHKHLCALHHARDHGPQPAWVGSQQSVISSVVSLVPTTGYSDMTDLAPFRFFGIFWKCARIGERLSPYVSICCILMAVSTPRFYVILSNAY